MSYVCGTYNSNEEKGFTLIELAVVLLIISMIVGGIVSAQSLIHSARITSVMQDITKWRTAYHAFQLQYDGIPGDLDNASEYWPGQTVNGDGDGLLNTTGNQITIDNGYDQDFNHFFIQLSLAGLIEGEFTNAAPAFLPSSNANRDIAFPKGPIEASFYIPSSLRIEDFFHSIAESPDGINVMLFAAPWGDASGYFLSPVLAPKDAFIIDNNMDDGMPGTGNIVGSFSYIWGGPLEQCNTSMDAADVDIARYNLSNQNKACRMAFTLEED